MFGLHAYVDMQNSNHASAASSSRAEVRRADPAEATGRTNPKPAPRYIPDRPIKPGEVKEHDKMAGGSDSTCDADAECDHSGPDADGDPEVEIEPEVLEDLSEISDEEPIIGRNVNAAAARLEASKWSTPPFAPGVLPIALPKADRQSSTSVSPGSPLPKADQQLSARALKDEEMWQARKNVTGAIGRLVFYERGQRPADDILGLARTPSGHVMVTAVRTTGPAAQAGVTTGHKLVSIDGQKSFLGVQTDDILRGLAGPISLVFLGFVGKILAEVQVDQPGAPSCGLPEVTDIGLSVVPKHESVELFDATMFQRHDASLLLSTGENRERSAKEEEEETVFKRITEDEDEGEGEVEVDPEPVFELQRKEARALVQGALMGGASATTAMFYI